MDICAKELAEREGRLYPPAKAVEGQCLTDQEDSEDEPFNPRTEVSADARYVAGRIVTHLWIIFVLFPVVAVLLLLAAGVLR
jgi:nitrate reductase NapE component